MNDQPPIQVSQEVFDGITLVRDSGLTNMFSISSVIHILHEENLIEAAEWILNNTGTYRSGIYRGFTVRND